MPSERSGPSSDQDETTKSNWIGLILASGGTLVMVGIAIRFYFGLITQPIETLQRFDHLGGAVAPFAALATVGALLAALWSVKLQREDLRLQREELKLQRQEMADSRAELKRTAEAQEELAKATRDATSGKLLDAQLRMLTQLEVDAEHTSFARRLDPEAKGRHQRMAGEYRAMRTKVLEEIGSLMLKQRGFSVPLAEAFRNEKSPDDDS